MVGSAKSFYSLHLTVCCVLGRRVGNILGVISQDRRKFSPSDVLFSNLIISTTTGDTKKLLIFYEKLGNEALYGFGFRSISLIVFERHSFEKSVQNNGISTLAEIANCQHF